MPLIGWRVKMHTRDYVSNMFFFPLISCSLVLGLGLLLSSLSKHVNHSNNPGGYLVISVNTPFIMAESVWPMLNEETGGYNKSGILLAFCALLELCTRPTVNAVITAPPKKNKTVALPPDLNPRSHWLSSSLALGSLFFTLHCMFTDSSTIIAWSWTGYEDRQPRGPLPHLYGSVTLIAQSLGLMIPIILSSSGAVTLLTHPLWFMYGCASAFVMYNFRDWIGFIGGLNFAVFCMSITPPILSQVATRGRNNPGRCYFVAFLVAVIFYFASVFTVAYAFVPGGVYFRERTNLYLLCLISSLKTLISMRAGSSHHSLQRYPLRSAGQKWADHALPFNFRVERQRTLESC